MILRILIAATSVIGVSATSVDTSDGYIQKTIVDLSQDFVEDKDASTTSPGATKIYNMASADPFMIAAVVLQEGKIVAKYYRDDVDKDKPNHLWSTTKSWISMLIGLLVDEGKLAVDETLGDIFTDESAWADVKVKDDTVEFRKAVTIEEMLSMTSGLISPRTEVMDFMLPPEELVPILELLIDGEDNDFGGSSLSNSLAYPEIGTKGDFSYLGGSQILSYVIKERAGMTPREYITSNIMPKLGIKEDEFDWWTNSDSIEYAYHGLHLPALHMAKLGQLYLQRGQYKPPDASQNISIARTSSTDDNQLISQDWVDESLKVQSADDTTLMMSYGYLWWIVRPGLSCTIGMFGQDTCIDETTNRVMVQQRDMDPANPLSGSLIIATAASDPKLSFDAVSDGTVEDESPQDDSSTGKGQNLSRNPALAPVLVLLSAVALPLLF